MSAILKRTIFGTPILVPEDTIVEVGSNGCVQGFYDDGTPIFDLSIIVKLSHANFDRGGRRFIAGFSFLGAVPFGRPKSHKQRTMPELERAVAAVEKAFYGVDDLVLDAYQKGEEITHQALKDFFNKNYKKCKGGDFILARRR
ncbi:MAG: hypothetical protein NUV60_02475 [Patescibacteria group bacterium]|nr:hypothetical protein [Patescibacteria group bacterium]